MHRERSSRVLWARRRPFSRPVGTTLSLPIAEAVWQLKKRPGFLLLHVILRDSRAVLMRGRPNGCELVIDASRVEACDVVPLDLSAMTTQNGLFD